MREVRPDHVYKYVYMYLYVYSYVLTAIEARTDLPVSRDQKLHAWGVRCENEYFYKLSKNMAVAALLLVSAQQQGK